MVEICFCAEGCVSVYCSWTTVPCVGDQVAFAAQAAKHRRFTVSEVIWEGNEEPDVTVVLTQNQRMPVVLTNGHVQRVPG
jgi:hypothetical protein